MDDRCEAAPRSRFAPSFSTGAVNGYVTPPPAFAGCAPLPLGGGVGYTLGMADVLQPRPRWYRLTPDHAVLGLLAVEALLWLSERYHWFAFNQHKGWTVLITAATVGVALLLMFFWFFAALVFRLRFQFAVGKGARSMRAASLATHPRPLR